MATQELTVKFETAAGIRFRTGVLSTRVDGVEVSLSMSLDGGTLMLSYGVERYELSMESLVVAWLEAIGLRPQGVAARAPARPVPNLHDLAYLDGKPQDECRIVGVSMVADRDGFFQCQVRFLASGVTQFVRADRLTILRNATSEVERPPRSPAVPPHETRCALNRPLGDPSVVSMHCTCGAEPRMILAEILNYMTSRPSGQRFDGDWIEGLRSAIDVQTGEERDMPAPVVDQAELDRIADMRNLAMSACRDERDRVILAKLLEGQTYLEIAQQLGVSRGLVYLRREAIIHRGRLAAAGIDPNSRAVAHRHPKWRQLGRA